MKLWKKGKAEIAKYYDLKLKKSTDIKSMFFGIILTIIVILPFLLILIQVFKVYIYDLTARYIILLISWLMLMLSNGLSNFFMVKLAKLYYPENPNLMAIDSKAILFYESLNIGFGLFTIALIFFFGLRS